MSRKWGGKLSLGGVEISIALQQPLVDRIKALPPYRLLLGDRSVPAVRNGEPDLNGTTAEDIDWYQTVDLPGGVSTPGFVDHRDQVELYGFPESLAGKRCLDVATFDGFWAFEMERRGAAEVIGIDVNSLKDCDAPTNFAREYLPKVPESVKGVGFAYAKRALGSKAQRKVLSVYDLSPETVGTFDFVFLSDLLIHLRDPLRALEALWSVTKPGGMCIVGEVVDPELEADVGERAVKFRLCLDKYSGWLWWYPTSSALKAMIQWARFQDVQEVARFDLATSKGEKLPKVVFHGRGGTG